MKTQQNRRSTVFPAPCSEWAERLVAGNPADQVSIRRHIAGCERCAAAYAAYQEVDASILRLPVVQPSAQQIAQLDAIIVEQVDSRVQPERVEAAPRMLKRHAASRSVPRWIVSLSATAAVVMIVGSMLLVLLAHGPGSATGAGNGNNDLIVKTFAKSASIRAVNKATGSIDWSTSLKGSAGEYFLVSGDMVFANDSNGVLYAIRTKDGKIAWQHKIPAAAGKFLKAVSSPYRDGNTLYLDSGTSLYAWRVSDGFQLWSHERPASCAQRQDLCVSAIEAVHNGVVYAYFDHLYALSASDGHVLWQDARFKYDEYDTTLSVIGDRVYAYLSQNKAIEVMQAETGQHLSTIALPQAADPVDMKVSKDTLYVVSGFHTLYAVRVKDSAILWQKHYDHTVHLFAVGNDQLYLQNTDVLTTQNTPTPVTGTKDSAKMYPATAILAVKASDGQTLWQWQRQGYFEGSAEAGDDTLYFHLSSGVYALRANDGQQEWYKDLGEPPPFYIQSVSQK